VEAAHQAASASHGVNAGPVATETAAAEEPALDVLAGRDRLPKIAQRIISKMMRAITQPHIPDLPFFSRLMSAMIFTSLRNPRFRVPDAAFAPYVRCKGRAPVRAAL
jgi:hypothetical protein